MVEVIEDFSCYKIKLVIEVDGSIHQIKEQKEYDTGRTDKLQSFGIFVLGFTNDQVLKQPDSVIKKIEKIVELLDHKAK